MASGTQKITLPIGSDAEWAWLAGILDGEGSFGVQPRGYPYISVGMKDRDIIRRVADVMGANRIWVANNKSHKGIWKAACQGQRALLVMDKIYLWMGERRRSKIDTVRLAAKLLPGQIRGEQCWLSKLTEVQVREIRRRALEGEMQADLAREFGLTQPGISAIILRKVWKHLKEKEDGSKNNQRAA